MGIPQHASLANSLCKIRPRPPPDHHYQLRCSLNFESKIGWAPNIVLIEIGNYGN